MNSISLSLNMIYNYFYYQIIWLYDQHLLILVIVNMINSNVHIVEPNDRTFFSILLPHSHFMLAFIIYNPSVLGTIEYLGLVYNLTWRFLQFSLHLPKIAAIKISFWCSNSKLYFISNVILLCQLSQTAPCKSLIFQRESCSSILAKYSETSE